MNTRIVLLRRFLAFWGNLHANSIVLGLLNMIIYVKLFSEILTKSIIALKNTRAVCENKDYGNHTKEKNK